MVVKKCDIEGLILNDIIEELGLSDDFVCYYILFMCVVIWLVMLV